MAPKPFPCGVAIKIGFADSTWRSRQISIRLGLFRDGFVDGFDARVLIEVADDEFAVVEAEFESIEPEAVVFGVGEPRAGLGLFDVDDDAFDGAGPYAAHARDLLGDPDACSDGVIAGEQGHGSECSGRVDLAESQVSCRLAPGQRWRWLLCWDRGMPGRAVKRRRSRRSVRIQPASA